MRSGSSCSPLPTPNAGHLALAELERRGLVTAIVTQNIDGLHQRAGSRDVVEVHGSIRSASCPECGERVPLEQVVAALREAPAPPCPRCGAVLKPDVVMFGELLPPDAIERATELVRQAGLFLVVGSSLEVHPVAGLPDEAAAAGVAVAILNRGPTPFDHLALGQDRRSGGRDVVRAGRGACPDLGCGALERLLFEEPTAVRTDLTLDVVGHSGLLPDRMNGDRGVLMPAKRHYVLSE